MDETLYKDSTEFQETDPFNRQNIVTGFISHRSTEYYGALIIKSVNGRTAEQLIMGTPKMHYPFSVRTDGTREYRFPAAKYVEVYEKLDGTNILAYRYTDGSKEFISYKTRLRPFAQTGRFGDFYSMWLEAAGPHLNEIADLMRKYDCNLSFELYGCRNPHLIMYKNILDIALLFGVTNTGRILPPSLFDTKIPPAQKLMVLDKDWIGSYEQLQKDLQSKLKKQEDEYYTGAEGAVWYTNLLDGRCIQLKNKPETIEAIHFSAGASAINKEVILATCWNALENVDVLTIEFIKQLLLEEFKPDLVEASHNTIVKSLDFIVAELEFRKSVMMMYKRIGKNILLEKVDVMREMSKHFPVKRMRKVYTTIISFG